jgi:hypothetical protein
MKMTVEERAASACATSGISANANDWAVLLARVAAQIRMAVDEDSKNLALTINQRFALGDRVEKIIGASWRGRVVGTYSSTFTAEGYCVEIEREPCSVQIYPATALRGVG